MVYTVYGYWRLNKTTFTYLHSLTFNYLTYVRSPPLNYFVYFTWYWLYLLSSTSSTLHRRQDVKIHNCRRKTVQKSGLQLLSKQYKQPTGKSKCYWARVDKLIGISSSKSSSKPRNNNCIRFDKPTKSRSAVIKLKSICHHFTAYDSVYCKATV